MWDAVIHQLVVIQVVQDLGFVEELRSLQGTELALDSHLTVILEVDSQEDLTESPSSKLLFELVSFGDCDRIHSL